MALISLPYAFLGQEPFFVGKIALVTKQKTNEKVERCIIQHGYVKDNIWFLSIFFPQEQFSSSTVKNKVACSWDVLHGTISKQIQHREISGFV